MSNNNKNEGNTESTSNSIKLAPMPLSALLENLRPLEMEDSSFDASYSSGESDDSMFETVGKNTPIRTNIQPKQSTPLPKSHTKYIKMYASENKNRVNKENTTDMDLSHRAYTNKENRNVRSVSKNAKLNLFPTLEVKNRSVLMTQDINIQKREISCTDLRKTPEVSKVQNHKTKTGTPTIKSGIRKFTPGSSRKSQKKSQLPMIVQSRDKVRCELFTQNQSRSDQPLNKPEPISAPKLICVRPAPVSVPVVAPVPVATAIPNPVAVAIPETPLNRKQLVPPCAATPSYPQGVTGHSSKVMFKTTNIKDKKYMFLKKLGMGGSSEVYKVLEVGTTCEYAVKCVYLGSDQDLAQSYINEVRLLRELQQSDRVIRLYDYEYDRANQLLRMVLEVGETDLSSLLKARGTGLPPALVLHYWEEMLLAVLYIHEHGVIHADLKPANFVLVSGRLKLIDFGIASAISGDATSVVRLQAAGTYSYISPEALMGGAGGYGRADGVASAPIKISFRSDVWSLGCILYSMVYGRTPFAHIPNLAKLAAILDPNHRIEYPPADHFPPTLISSLRWCLTYNARARPSVKELLAARHLASARRPLPRDLIDKLSPHLTADELILLQRAQV